MQPFPTELVFYAVYRKKMIFQRAKLPFHLFPVQICFAEKPPIQNICHEKI